MSNLIEVSLKNTIPSLLCIELNAFHNFHTIQTYLIYSPSAINIMCQWCTLVVREIIVAIARAWRGQGAMSDVRHRRFLPRLE